MGDYDRLMDNATRAFIARTDSFYPPDAVNLTIPEQRAVYDRMCAAFRAPRPAGLLVEDRAIAGVPCRIYGAASDTHILYAHGGGFVVGNLDSHDDVCAEMAVATGVQVISVDYRLVPEHLHPAAYEDVMAVAHALSGPLVLAGDSAGAALVASAAHGLRGRADLRGLLLIYPALGGDRSQGSYVSHAHAPMLSTADVIWYAQARHGGQEPEEPDVTVGTLHDLDFSGLPPVVVASAECDPLADDGHVYAERIIAAGGRAEWLLDEGLVHGWLRARHSVPRAEAAFARLLDRLKTMTGGA
ncbi:alpha/beta hydrolase [Gemmobacter serpentinus]|uniref:alpha/beta hydrolase n=1 Tax=Gemmobacter serpentinus TaxID=2652247 RepID=UPI00124CF898|nr:alpha/beta hydrolase [Gemmobacter serpentinus]